ncbi:MAG TPA: ACT domain-containing protein [Burkholderiaceae bacterium]|nr:ACT domain-containing protein [Burkholderiaceae bacterium]
MYLDIQPVHVWAAPIEDKPGSLAAKLKALQKAGADLQFIIARRSPDKPGSGVVFVAPLEGEALVQEARQMGFGVTRSLQSIRVMGLDKPGVMAEMTAALADAGINLRGLTSSSLGSQFVAYFGLDSDADLVNATDVLGRL